MSEKVTPTSDSEAEDSERISEQTPEHGEGAPAEADGGDDIAIEVDASELDQGEADPLAALEARVAELEKEKQDNYDRLLRATADLDNFRKRSRRDIDDAKVDARTQVLREMLPVVDNLERAIAHAAGAGEAAGESILEGVKLVLRQFVQAFERCDVSSFDSVGQPFDPNLHEAVGQIETDDQAPGAVAQELQRGYKIGQRLLRPAMVVVAKAPASPEPEETAENGHDKGNGAAGPVSAGNGSDSEGEG